MSFTRGGLTRFWLCVPPPGSSVAHHWDALGLKYQAWSDVAVGLAGESPEAGCGQVAETCISIPQRGEPVLLSSLGELLLVTGCSW